MQPPNLPPVVRDLVLVGGGHSHVQVLKAFAMRPEPGIRLTLISKERDSPYSGMLPGCISGVYSRDDIHIQLDRLCQYAGARFIQAEVTGLQATQSTLQLRDRPDMRFDSLSINCGAAPASPHRQAVTVKPIAEFLPKWAELRARIEQQAANATASVAVIGAGAGGIELVLAMRAVLPAATELFVVGRSLLPGHNARVQQRVLRKLQQHRVSWLQETAVVDEQGGVSLSNGRQLDAEHVLWVTDVCAPAWLADSQLALDDAGFIKVNQHLQSVSHEHIFAAGDVAHLVGQQRAKSGVYAVRAGPYLARNLRRQLTGRTLRRFRAQPLHLALIGTADGSAIASRGALAFCGPWWWLLKDYIDWSFMNKFNKLPTMPEVDYALSPTLRKDLPLATMRCGGCGAKLAADPLRRVLQRLPKQDSAQVTLGIGDDAAELINTGPATLLTVDGFRAMLDDPYLFGRIAAHHSLNDIFAMGATATAALALVTVPLMAEDMMEEDLFQLLSGATAVLNEHGVPLVGGHSAEGAELSIGLTITGAPARADRSVAKSGACVGDKLILTKPLGTGVMLAAAMRGIAAQQGIEQVLSGMNHSNLTTMQVLLQHQVSAMTDVTGFGLAGHLGEMLRPANLGVRLWLDAVPAYPGAADLLASSASSLQTANELALQDFTLMGGLRGDDAKLRLLADPQTSGGLLATVPAGQLQHCLEALHNQGVAAAHIGEITDSEWLIE